MAGKAGRSGRPIKPAAIKRLEGNPGKRPIQREPKASGLPVPPSIFNDEQRRLWLLVLSFMPQGLIAACDGPMLEIFVFAWWTHREARRQINDLGLMVRSGDGPIRNPLLGIARGAAADMHRVGADLGLSPLARTRLIEGDPDSFDPIALLLGDDDEPQTAH